MIPGVELKDINANATGELKTGGKIKINDKEYTVVVKGDTDGNGKVNSSDALAILKHSAGLEELKEHNLLAANVNGDGKINSSAALSVLKHSAGLEDITL